MAPLGNLDGIEKLDSDWIVTGSDRIWRVTPDGKPTELGQLAHAADLGLRPGRPGGRHPDPVRQHGRVLVPEPTERQAVGGGLHEAAEALVVRRAGDAELGHDGRHERGRGHVEGPVQGRHTCRGEASAGRRCWTSSGERSSTGMSAPVLVARSIVDVGAAT